MKVELTITLDVEGQEDAGQLADKPRVLRSVREAIEHAIRYGQGEGHVHDMSESISIMLGEVGEATEAPQTDFPISFTLHKDGKLLSRHSVRNREEKQSVVAAAQRTYGNVTVENLRGETCDRCGTALTPGGYCGDVTCPFSDHKQDCPAGWQDHPEHKGGACTCKGT
jgi:hypothetical protein